MEVIVPNSGEADGDIILISQTIVRERSARRDYASVRFRVSVFRRHLDIRREFTSRKIHITYCLAIRMEFIKRIFGETVT